MFIKKIKTLLLSIIVLLICLVFIQACEKSDSSSLLRTIDLSLNETKNFSHQGKNVSVTATHFYDSRCPINANCVTQGYASVKIRFKDEIKEQDLTLCIGGCSLLSIPLPQTVELNGSIYRIKLENIIPYPTLDKVNPEPSKAKITLSE